MIIFWSTNREKQIFSIKNSSKNNHMKPIADSSSLILNSSLTFLNFKTISISIKISKKWSDIQNTWKNEDVVIVLSEQASTSTGKIFSKFFVDRTNIKNEVIKVRKSNDN